MKISNQNNMGSAQLPYVTPEVKVVKINVQGLLCTSKQPAGSTQQYEVEDDNNPWE